MKLREFKTMRQSSLEEKKHYLIYCRKSSESEDRQMQSIEDQVNVLTQLAKEKQLPVLKIFRESKSAKGPGRPIFNEMIQKINERKDIKGVLCWNLSRLSRNPIDTATIQWLLQQSVIEEVIAPSRVYTELDSDLIMGLEGGLANRFIRDLRKDTKRGIDSKLQKGHFPGFAPPGYVNNTHKNQGEKDISSHPVYFSLMRKVFELALTGNFSVEGLAVKANVFGIKNNRGSKISKTAMYKIVQNPFYTGKFLYAGQLYQGVHQSMLTEEEFDLLQDILSGRSRPRKIKHDFPLTGLIHCGECGMMITAETKSKTYKNGNSQTFTYYHCTRKNKEMKCREPYISDKELESQVDKFLATIKLSSRFVDWAIKWLNEANKDQKEAREARYKALKASYEAVLAKIDNLLDLKISPYNKDKALLSDEEFARKNQELMEEKTRIHGELTKVDKHIEEWTELAAKTFDFAATAQERFEKGGIDDKKTILRAIGSNLILKDKRLEIQPRTPFLLIKEALDNVGAEKWLEPNEKTDITPQTGDLQPQNVVWGG